ncbi:hypothetical protein ABW20_dc0104458 [Dactylellina cionopaga]|nr:hypothetical protein ABW20_dc0104458 [Dactylellina cionopaga]
MSTVYVGLGTASAGTPLSNNFSSDPFARAVNDGTQGGHHTADYFQKMTSFGAMLKKAATAGMTAWTKSTDCNGLPTYSMSLESSSSEIFVVEFHTQNLNINTNTVSTNSTGQTIDGEDFHGIGYQALTFTYNRSVYTQFQWWIGINTSDNIEFASVKPAIAAITDSVVRHFTLHLPKLMEIDDRGGIELQNAIEGAESDTRTAIGEILSVKINRNSQGYDLLQGFVALSLKVAAACIGPSVAKGYIFQHTKLWNFSKYRVRWYVHFDNSLHFMDQGCLKQLPGRLDSKGDIVSFFPIEAMSREKAGDSSSSWRAYSGDFGARSSARFSGLSYVMRLEFVDPQNEDRVLYGCVLMFDIPIVGDNSTSLSLDEKFKDADDEALQQYCDRTQGKKEPRQAAQSSDLKLKVTTTFDSLTGEHPIPNHGGNFGLYYQSMIVINESDLSSSDDVESLRRLGSDSSALLNPKFAREVEIEPY